MIKAWNDTDMHIPNSENLYVNFSPPIYPGSKLGKSYENTKIQSVVNQVVLLHYYSNKKKSKLNLSFTHRNNNFDNILSIKVVNSLPKLGHFWLSAADCQFLETLALVEIINLGNKKVCLP